MDANRLCLLLTSGELERVQLAAMLASVASVSGTEVDLFVSMNAVLFFKKGTTPQEVPVGGALGKLICTRNVPAFADLFRQGKALGSLRVYACAMVMDLLGWHKEDLEDFFDDVIGLSAFLGKAEGAQLTVI